MNEDQLRAALVGEVKQKIEDPISARRNALLAEAKRVAEKFAACTDPDERPRLQRRYVSIDVQLGDLKKEEERLEREGPHAIIADTEEAPRNASEAHERHLENIEKERKRLMERQKAGASDAAHNRIRAELEYLLKNYNPANDGKIATLIDKWRTSGDPSYDPAIKLRFRRVLRDKERGKQAF